MEPSELPSIFPHAVDAYNRMQGKKFVHYTSAASAIEIIKNKRVWMRNAMNMNDYMEIEHGAEVVRSVLLSDASDAFFDKIAKLSGRDVDHCRQEVISWVNSSSINTYITCLSEHDFVEDERGRLSMWRAYATSNGVALILNSKPFLRQVEDTPIASFPVLYASQGEIRSILEKAISKLRSYEDVNKLRHDLYYVIRIMAICSKHPGFCEEREWRIFFTEGLSDGSQLESSLGVVGSVPQKIYKIPLIDSSKLEFSASINQLLHRIIIGPTHSAISIKRAFVDLLSGVGIDDAFGAVRISDIPLR